MKIVTKVIVSLFLLVSFISCSYINLVTGKADHDVKLSKNKKEYHLKDQTGEFTLQRQKAIISKNGEKLFVVKKRLFEGKGPLQNDQIVEQSVTLSNFKDLKIKENIKLLSPMKSEYVVWFDKKKYISRMQFNSESKELTVKLNSLEERWSGEKKYQLPVSGDLAYCFYSQIIECAKVATFIKQVLKKKRGTMNLYVIWEGYPYIKELFVNMPNAPFSKASFSFDGQNSLNEKRFSLKIKDHVLLYFIDDKLQLKKVYWPSQGLSIELKSFSK